MRTTALNAHPPCAEDTGRAGAQAPGVRVLCRNPYSRSQRTPCPAPPPAQSRRREVGGREGRHTPRDQVVVEVEDPRRATATGRPGGRPSHFHGWQYVAIPATTCSGAGGGKRRRGGRSGTARGRSSGTARGGSRRWRRTMLLCATLDGGRPRGALIRPTVRPSLCLLVRAGPRFVANRLRVPEGRAAQRGERRFNIRLGGVRA